ncbi:tRNA 2-selenouridine synthase [Bdellovibrio bacteriovorus]|uniref:tRNA 2-selenouridine synthase n=1 Tax=Bdellovibrio bacteriovorus TaxID=959 RepID=A0A161PCL8_BDEBC|nr:tRNA 2-selenouridine(34) synthase MnmH [Bdellovibrio bacteriovorus]KYG67804.1 tRNA 2-selenouridine synthase [Bdellovibrio bacteriovorus]
MSNERIPIEQYKNLFLSGAPLIDVRAPVEFAQGHLPHAVNIPILNDEERALIGTTYKREGQEAAVALGYQIVSGDVKADRVQRWKDFVQTHPGSVVYCFRGGKRSQITQAWLAEAGISVPIIAGGYKKARQFFSDELDKFCNQRELLVVSGPTGSGKTDLLKEVSGFYPTMDLELLARHRGSAFGSLPIHQPTQIDFEIALALDCLKIEDKTPLSIRPLVEDESRLIGRICQPKPFFERLRSSEVLWLDEAFETRVENIFTDYVLNTDIGEGSSPQFRCAEEEEILRGQALKLFAKYREAVLSIRRKLGGLRSQEILADLQTAESQFLAHGDIQSNKIWIEKLLSYYYDPLYLSSLERRQVRVLFKGPRHEVVAFLKSLPQ